MTRKLSYPRHKVRILLAEKIHAAARERLVQAGYSVEEVPKALSEAELLECAGRYHVLGIRSRTRITEAHLERATRLLAVGCFGVGTNQVVLDAAALRGVPVFNAPHSSTRSVAELALTMVLMLARQMGDKNCSMHRGLWDKSSAGAHEVRGKTLGLVGYGHIGQQLGLLAEGCGMQVSFFDKMKKLPLGNARATAGLADLLAGSDFVSLHLPGMPKGKTPIGRDEIEKMKKGACLINTSRGSLVDLDALERALHSGHLSGAGLDVFPSEPESSREPFRCALAGLPNVVLAPHIGGSTEEAQYSIALEVADSFIRFIDAGTTTGAVNFPQAELPPFAGSHRILNIHRNVPGVLSKVNRIVSSVGANIDQQYLATYREIGYLIMDLNAELSEEVRDKIAALRTSIRTRILY